MLLDGQNHLDSGRSGFFFLLAHNVLHFPLTDKGMPKHWHSLLWKALSTRFVCQNKTKNPKASSGINLFLKCLYNKVLKDLKEAINICINYYPAFIIYNYSTKNKGRNSREEKKLPNSSSPFMSPLPFHLVCVLTLQSVAQWRVTQLLINSFLAKFGKVENFMLWTTATNENSSPVSIIHVTL